MPRLTPQVWNALGQRPIVLAFNPLAVQHRLIPNGPFSNNNVRQFPFAELVGHLCYSVRDDGAVAQFREELKRARREFRLDQDEPVRIAIVGNESSMAVMTGAEWVLGCTGLSSLFMREAVGKRRLSCLIESALERLGGIALCPLARLPGAVIPALSCPRKYARLIKKVRGRIDKARLKHLTGAPKTLVKRPATIRLYVHGAGWLRRWWPTWRRLKVNNPPPTRMKEADLLIKEFEWTRRDAMEKGRRPPEGLLVKLIGSRDDRHSVVDLPMLTGTQYEAARAAGIQAILIDTRGVIWNDLSTDCAMDQWAVPPVYGV